MINRENLWNWKEVIVKDTENPENLKIGKEIIANNTEKSGKFWDLKGTNCKKYWKSGEFKDLKGNACKRYRKIRRIWRFEKKWLLRILKSAENLTIKEEMIVEENEKSGKCEDWVGNGCKRYWTIRRIWRFEKKWSYNMLKSPENLEI